MNYLQSLDDILDTCKTNNQKLEGLHYLKMFLLQQKRNVNNLREKEPLLVNNVDTGKPELVNSIIPVGDVKK